jgi:septal ring factor EnvC (AmiA/AmiB activator)
VDCVGEKKDLYEDRGSKMGLQSSLFSLWGEKKMKLQSHQTWNAVCSSVMIQSVNSELRRGVQSWRSCLQLLNRYLLRRARTLTHIHTQTHTQTHTEKHTHKHTHTNTHTNTHTHRNIHTHTQNTQTHTRTHTQTHTRCFH